MFPACYAIIVGLLMIGQWGFFLATGQVPELASRPIEIGLHLLAEGLTALALIIGGIAGLKHRRWASPLLLVGFGMLIYTLIQSPGYFAQRQVWPIVVMFAVLLVLAIIAVGQVFRAWLILGSDSRSVNKIFW